MGRRKLSHRVGPFLGRLLGPTVIRLLGSSWTLALDPPDLAARVLSRGPAIYTIWHGRMLVPAYVFRGCGVAVMISRHADGEVIARIVEALGFRTVRGSSTRGGAAALHDAVVLLREGGSAAFTPDGPKGPLEVAQPGALFAASRSGAPLIPLGVGVKSARILRSWDRFRLPRPFTRVSVVEGEPLLVPADADDAELEKWRLRFQERQAAADRRAERFAETGAP